jgi:PAS domain-containing protein
MQATATPDEIIEQAVAAIGGGEAAMRAALDDLPAPIYTTDRDGRVTFFNQACIGFAGRTPVAGEDRWCVTWKLYTTDGAALPHEECPMAVAIREKRPVRGAEAIAERPDGSRVSFVPYPTPLFDADGALVGAVNMLIDVTVTRQADHLRAQAVRCRRLAASVNDRPAVATLTAMAAEYEDQARALHRPH